MKINHIAIYVSDLESNRSFFEKYFGARSNTMYHNPRTGLKTYFLSFDDDVRIEIMSRAECEKANGNEFQLGFAHLAFSVGSRDEVDRLTAQLEADGYVVASQPRVTGDGYYESVVLDNDGNRIEITE